MEQSLFIKYVNSHFKGITVSVVEKLNDTKLPLSYLHRRMLKKDFSVSGKWESISVANSQVMADVVSMDSSLPLKKRASFSKANGDIPKMGMELKLNERQLTELDTLVASGAADSVILRKLFEDTPKVISGIYERCEAMFLQGLSTGVALVEDDENVGTGIRLDYGYSADNKFGASVVWSDVNAKPFDDIERVLEKANADGHTITRVLLDSNTIKNIARTAQAKELYAFNAGFVGANIPTPDLNQLNQVASSRYGFVFEKVDRSVRYEKNGVQSIVKPWAAGNVVFLTSDQVGSLVYATLAEQNHPVANVTYANADGFILVSKYRLNKPSLSEYTSSQARVVPVINNVDAIYLLESTVVEA